MMSKASSASSLAPFDSSTSEKRSRKSYTCEFKLIIVHFYRANNLYQMSNKLPLNTKTILRWAGNEELEDKRCQEGKQACRSCQESDVSRNRDGTVLGVSQHSSNYTRPLSGYILKHHLTSPPMGGLTVSRSDIISVSGVYKLTSAKKPVDDKKSADRSFHKTIC